MKTTITDTHEVNVFENPWEKEPKILYTIKRNEIINVNLSDVVYGFFGHTKYVKVKTADGTEGYAADGHFKEV